MNINHWVDDFNKSFENLEGIFREMHSNFSKGTTEKPTRPLEEGESSTRVLS